MLYPYASCPVCSKPTYYNPQTNKIQPQCTCFPTNNESRELQLKRDLEKIREKRVTEITLRDFALALYFGEQWAEEIVNYIELHGSSVSEDVFFPECKNCLFSEECMDDEKYRAEKQKFCPRYIPV